MHSLLRQGLLRQGPLTQGLLREFSEGVIRMKPYLIERRCPAQETMCTLIAACPAGAVAYIKDEQAPLGGRIAFDYEKCDGCGKCLSACCGQAVELR